MSIINERYGVPEETVKKMMKDGVISCCWNTYDQIVRLRKDGKTWDEVGFELNMTGRNAQHIYSRGAK